MKTAAVSESKVRLSGFLRQVKAGSNVEREGGLGLGKEQQVKVGCCGFAVAQKKYFELFKNEPLFGAMDYFRLHGAADYIYTYTDKELEALREKLKRKPTYVMLNNNTMKDDALRFVKALGMR